MMHRLMLCGSRNATPDMIAHAEKWVFRAYQRHDTIINVGDNPQGVDLAVVQACTRYNVPCVVMGLDRQPRNGGATNLRSTYICYWREHIAKKPEGGWTAEDWHMRDRELIDPATIVVCIWDGQSPGTRKAYEYALNFQTIRADAPAFPPKQVHLYTAVNAKKEPV